MGGLVYQNIGPRLAYLRRQAGLTQSQLAERLGVRSYQTIQKWEKGERTLTYRYMVKIARALGHAVKREKDVMPLFFPPASSVMSEIEYQHRKRQIEPQLEAKPESGDLDITMLDAPLGFFAWRPHSNQTVHDARVKAACGLPPDARTDFNTWHERIHSDDVARVDAKIVRLLDPRHGLFKKRYRIIGWDGIERCVFDLAHAVFKNGKATRVIGAKLDVTRRPRSDNEGEIIKGTLRAAAHRFIGLTVLAATEVDPVLLLGALFLRGNLENLLQGSNRIEADNLR